MFEERENTSMKEVWKDVPGFEGFYQVSNLGRVRSIAVRRCLHGKIHVINREHIMTPTDNGNGYLMVNLRENNKRTSVGVHRLVASAFVDKPEGCNVVNHIDFDTHNNNCNNLEWCTQKQNIIHSLDNMKHPRKSKLPKTGKKYIHEKDNKFRVCIKQINVYKSFATLHEAIRFRDKKIKDNGWYFKEGGGVDA